MIKIDKNIPVPEIGQRGAKRKYPFYEMEVGDSFYTEIKLNNMRATAAFAQSKIAGSKFVCAAEGEGTRVWRTK